MKRWLAALFLTAASASALAGSQAATQATFAPERVISFAKQVERVAAEKGAYAFIIARQGRPESELPEGIEFTHTAIAVYSNITLDDGTTVPGYAIHNLYQMAEDRDHSRLVTDYPVDFFWGAQALKTGIIIPSLAVQQRLVDIYTAGEDKKLHNPNYSVIANPFNSRYQNCTEFTLDVVNAAIYHTTETTQLKANAKAYFTAQPVKVSRLKLGLGSLFADGLHTSDHKRRIETATFHSMARYLAQYNLTQDSFVMTEDGQISQL